MSATGTPPGHAPGPARRSPVLGALAVLAMLVLLVIGHHVSLFPDNLLGRDLRNALHLPAFACLAFLVCWFYPRLGAVRAGLACLLVGALFELSQIPTGREASFVDLARDGIGIAGGAVLARGRPRQGLAALAVMLVISAALPLRTWLSYLERDAIFPAFLDPGFAKYSGLFSSNSPATVTRVEAGGESVRALRLCWLPVEYPGFQVDEVVPTWAGFQALEVSVVIEGPGPMKLTVAVGRRGVPGTYAYVSRDLEPGPQVWRVPLSSLTGDSGSAAQLPISHLIVHSSPAYAGRCAAFTGLRLR